ncbi:type IX secretion system membrane protein PorP/SprF [Pedobacter sp. HMF7647]|uniref:Type IX secretion system membrane protein PorP/SprF n=1 Tax=Hufsiella arboris TaxID=2695275 RepID=A0A7K1Y8C4_9SPHI|nr:type IX secretion system membrane protein PorP/SprF [Hufsiella arboris]MXV50835.1 type IX secretion system membrane protein PorP/SprF [Hufsiella arboris]
MKRSLLVLFILFYFIPVARSQQDPQYSQYMFNSLVINPAYAGYKEVLNVSMLHRDQWTGLPGSPKTESLIVDGAFFNENRIGIGLSIVNDKIGLQRQSSAYLNYAYRLPMGDDESRLAFGLAFGVSQYVLNGDRSFVDNPDDPNFANGNQSRFTPDAKFGVYYSNERFFAGASVTNLLGLSIDYQKIAGSALSRQGRHYFISGGYLADLGENFKLKPSILIKDDAKSQTTIDLNTFLLIKEMVWVGASYRSGVSLWKKSNMNTDNFQQNSMVGAIEVFVARNLRFGYAFDYSLSDLSSVANGTHEISLGFSINTARRSSALLTPRYF